VTDLPARRHVELESLPPAMVERLRFERAAPKRFRDEHLPAPIRAELGDLWDGIIADVYDEVAGLRRTKAFRAEQVARVLARIADRVLQAQRVVIFTAVHYPLPYAGERRHVAFGAASGGAAAAVEEVAAFATAGTAATIAIAAAVVGEVLESYIAASARTGQYREQHWPADPATVVLDLAEAAGYTEAVGRRATAALAHKAVDVLGQALLRRTASRFARGLIPVFGVAVGAGVSGWNINRVQRLALRPPSEEALKHVVLDYLNDPDGYAREQQRWMAPEPPQLPPPPAPPPPPPPPVPPPPAATS
jgi:hypothetical protein